MIDLFTTLVSSPVAKKVGVPQPTTLRRYHPGVALCDTPVLVAGDGRFGAGLTDWLATLDVATVGRADASPDPLGAVVIDLSAETDPSGLDQLRVIGAPAVKRLAQNGRVIVVGTDPATLTHVAAVSTQRALEGAVRSIGKELRAGATANLVLAQGDSAAGVQSAVEFFLSGRSAYVDGQVGARRGVHDRESRCPPAARREGRGRHRRGSGDRR